MELLAALAIGGMVLLMGSRFFTVLTDGSRRVVEAEAPPAGELPAAGYRWLRRAFESLEVGRSGGDGFTGNGNAVEFTARIMDGRGILGSRRVRIDLREGALRHTVGEAPALPLVRTGVAGRFEYLQGESGQAWMSGWQSPSTAPVAVRMILERVHGADTVAFTIGRRN